MPGCFAIQIRSLSRVAPISSRGYLLKRFAHVVVVDSLGNLMLLSTLQSLSRGGTRFKRNQRSTLVLGNPVTVTTSQTHHRIGC